jgi:hypothetical protein
VELARLHGFSLWRRRAARSLDRGAIDPAGTLGIIANGAGLRRKAARPGQSIDAGAKLK